MRLVCGAALMFLIVSLAGPGTVPAADLPTFHLYFLGHDIGRETDVWSGGTDSPHLQSSALSKNEPVVLC